MYSALFNWTYLLIFWNLWYYFRFLPFPKDYEILAASLCISGTEYDTSMHCSILECWERGNRFVWFCRHINCSCYWEGMFTIICPFICLELIWLHYILILQGLMTPIVRNADQKSISSISSEVSCGKFEMFPVLSLCLV